MRHFLVTQIVRTEGRKYGVLPTATQRTRKFAVIAPDEEQARIAAQELAGTMEGAWTTEPKGEVFEIFAI